MLENTKEVNGRTHYIGCQVADLRRAISSLSIPFSIFQQVQRATELLWAKFQERTAERDALEEARSALAGHRITLLGERDEVEELLRGLSDVLKVQAGALRNFGDWPSIRIGVISILQHAAEAIQQAQEINTEEAD